MWEKLVVAGSWAAEMFGARVLAIETLFMINTKVVVSRSNGSARFSLVKRTKHVFEIVQVLLSCQWPVIFLPDHCSGGAMSRWKTKLYSSTFTFQHVHVIAKKFVNGPSALLI
jgi:hypothetical protein